MYENIFFLKKNNKDKDNWSNFIFWKINIVISNNLQIGMMYNIQNILLKCHEKSSTIPTVPYVHKHIRNRSIVIRCLVVLFAFWLNRCLSFILQKLYKEISNTSFCKLILYCYTLCNRVYWNCMENDFVWKMKVPSLFWQRGLFWVFVKNHNFLYMSPSG